MKDHTDNHTGELIAPAKKRGRPSTGKAMSAATRKREQRAREMAEVLTSFNFETVTTSGLLAMMANAQLRDSIGHMAWREFGKRFNFRA